MKYLKLSAAAACCLLVASCSGKKEANNDRLCEPFDCTLTVNNLEGLDGEYVYIYDWDALAGVRDISSATALDSAIVEEGTAKFSQTALETPILFFYNGSRGAIIFPETGENTFDAAGNAGSGKIAKLYKEYIDSINNIYISYFENRPGIDSDEYDTYVDSFNNLIKEFNNDALNANIDNTFGLFLVASASEKSLGELDSLMNINPTLKNSKRVQNLYTAAKNLEATQPGSPYVDFEITYNGEAKKLSDYVKPGEYTLVDFWASWCNPCKMAIAELKDNYEDLTAKGLNIVGVAVWEDSENTEEWLNENPLPWPLILNAQSIPTDLYGIKGIPTLVLVGPDGKIIARGYSEEEILEAFEDAIADK